MGWKGASMSIPGGGGGRGRCCKSVVLSVSLAPGESCSALVMSAISL